MVDGSEAVTPKGDDDDGGGSFWSVENAIMILLAIIIIFVVQYSALRVRYHDIYSAYSLITDNPANSGVFVNIGPQRIMLGYEYPTLSSTFLSRPIPQSAAEFMLRLIRTLKMPVNNLLSGFATDLSPLKQFVVSEATWKSDSNPLGPSGVGLIPYDSQLVSEYTKPLTNTSKDLSLEVIWLYGYEEYVRQRFTAGATSVLQEWNYMFGSVAASPPGPGDSACNPVSMGAGAVSQGAMYAAMGAAIVPPFGAIVGGLIGAGSSLLSSPQCLGL